MSSDFRYTRRNWLGTIASAGVGATVASAVAGCIHMSNAQSQPGAVDRKMGRLQTVHRRPTGTALPGETSLGLDGRRDGLRYVPSSYSPVKPAPLVLMLHGATGQPVGGMRPFRTLADAAGMVLLAPSSREASWDVRYGAFGPDVKFIDAALEQTFQQCNIDPNRIFIAGFSDGASYALSLGLSNGALFKKVVAFSPGFYELELAQGKPPIFISHGTQDQILNIDSASRRMVPLLRAKGYDVTYQEFVGPHTVPPDIAIQAKDWLFAPAK